MRTIPAFSLAMGPCSSPGAGAWLASLLLEIPSSGGRPRIIVIIITLRIFFAFLCLTSDRWNTKSSWFGWWRTNSVSRIRWMGPTEILYEPNQEKNVRCTWWWKCTYVRPTVATHKQNKNSTVLKRNSTCPSSNSLTIIMRTIWTTIDAWGNPQFN